MGIIETGEVDQSVQIGKMKLKNPVITASGTFGYSDEYSDFMDLQGIGALITKGITLHPRMGNPQPRIKEVKGGLINSIGLENVGIRAFIDKKLPVLREKGIEFIVNIAGESVEEYKELASICNDAGIGAVELNLSCPNVDKGCLEFGRDEATLNKLVSGVREVFPGTLIVKLGSNVSFPEKIALAAQNAGADAISAINTVKAMNISINDGNKGFRFIKGGLSGPCIKPVALNFIWEIRKAVSIPIIGMGGIASLTDMLEFFAAGASAVQIGTGTFMSPDMSGRLAKELRDFMEISGYNNLQDLILDLGLDLRTEGGN